MDPARVVWEEALRVSYFFNSCDSAILLFAGARSTPWPTTQQRALLLLLHCGKIGSTGPAIAACMDQHHALLAVRGFELCRKSDTSSLWSQGRRQSYLANVGSRAQFARVV